MINTLQKLRVNNPLKIIAGQLNISSIKNKFNPLCSIFKQKINIFLVSATKIDDTFPVESSVYRATPLLTDFTDYVKEGGYCYM